MRLNRRESLPLRVDRHRFKHCWNAEEWARMALMQAEDATGKDFPLRG